MGVTIHYRGRLNDIGALPSLIDEVKDIATTMGWPFTVLDDDWSQPCTATLRAGAVQPTIDGNLGLKGIQIHPHEECEPLALFFDKDGYLRSPMTMLLILDGTLKADKASVFIKTQFAGPDVHVWVIGFLKYLKKRHIANLKVMDEGRYWETGDRAELERLMEFIASKLDFLRCALSSERMGDLRNLSADEIAARIEQLVGIGATSLEKADDEPAPKRKRHRRS